MVTKTSAHSLVCALLASGTLVTMASCQRVQLPAATGLTSRTASVANIRTQGTEQPSKAGQVVIRFKRAKSLVGLEKYAQDNQLKILRVLSQGKTVLFQHQKQGVSTQNVIRSFSASTDVETSQPNYIYKAAQIRQPLNFRRANSNITYAQSAAPVEPAVQYAHRAMQLDNAWQITQGNPNVKIAIIDSGVDATHPELKQNLLPGASFVANSKVTNGPAWTDEFGHGTHVAGIVSAALDNVGVSGVAPRCKVLPIKVLDNYGNGDSMSVIEGIAWASQQGAQVINLSLGGFDKDEAMAKVIDEAVAKGAVVVAATGNQGGHWDFYPAALDNVIGVGSIDIERNRAETSNYGEWISVVAPGVNILSTYPTYPLNNNSQPSDPYSVDSGTSMAAPAVAGVAALLLSQHPQLTPNEVKWRIENSAADIGEPGFDKYYGHGMVNAAAALNMGEMNAFR